MAEKKRVTTAPLTDEDIAEQLDDIPADEFLARFDEIITRNLELPEALEELLTLDGYMESELRGTFQSIVAQYIRPVEYAVGRVLAGESSKRLATEGLEAVGPILAAADSLKYEDIAALLRDVERPLAELRDGARRRLNKKDLAGLGAAWERLRSALRMESEREAPAATPAVSLAALARHVEGVTPAHVRLLHGAGITTLGELASAPAADIASVAGLTAEIAARVRAFAAGASVAASAPPAATAAGAPAAPEGIPTGWMRVRIDSDVLEARVTFRYGSLGRYVEPILARLAQLEEGEGRAAAAEPPAGSRRAPARERKTRK